MSHTTSVLSLVRSLRLHRRLVRDFVVRDLKARYVGSTMGFFWSVVFPIINLFVYMFVFRLVLNARWADGQGALEVAVVMLAGIVVWTAFAETISRSTNSLVENANLIQKVVFPAEILPCYLTLSSLINMCIGLPVVLGAVLFFGHLAPPEAYIHTPRAWVEDPAHPGEQMSVVKENRIAEWTARVEEKGGPADTTAHEFPFRIEITRGWRRPIRIPIRVSGTAERGKDYELPVDEITIPAGHLSATVVIVPLPDDEQTEGDETVVIDVLPGGDVPVLGMPSRIELAGTRMLLTITDAPPVGPKARRQGDPGVHLTDAVDTDYHPLSLGPGLVALPILFALQVLFTVGIGYFLAAFNLFLRDTFHVVGVGVTVWMFSTPIFYPGSMVEKEGFGIMLLLNPMHWLIESYRRIVLYGLFPDPWLVLRFAVVALVTFYLGGRFFMSHRSKFPDLL